MPLIGNVLKALANSVLMPLGLTAVSPTDAAIYQRIFRSGNTTLIISNEELNDAMELIMSIKESGLLIKDINNIIKNEAKGQKGAF